MLLRGIAGLLLGLLGLMWTTHCQAQQWARDMFQETSHDFGIISRGSKPQFRFVFENKYKEDVHVKSVKSSCGCTEPSIEKETLKSREKGAIIAELNTVTYSGDKSAVITVVFDKPFYAELQLNIKGKIRSDVVFEPTEINFGRVDEGSGKELTATVTYAGRSDWAINDVRSTYEHISVQLGTPERKGGTVRYNLVVKLKNTAPVGVVTSQLSIVPNDGSVDALPLPLKAEILPTLSITPTSFDFGKVKAGSTVKKTFVLKGPTPFAIANVVVQDPRLKYKLPKGKKSLQIIEMEFDAGNEAKPLQETLSIVTDLPGQRAAACQISATVEP